ncbi:MAG: hypothetical protein LBC39_07170 [Methanobrevibacter sp.]|jgi:predicted transposase/invertase (TIGR01784 family)|nr:hypothetical protein [Candidatus Methanovirga aequatorialis]
MVVYIQYLTIYNLNVLSFRKIKKDLNNPLHRWLIFFDIRSTDKILKKVIEMDEDIKLADKKFNELLADEEVFHDYQMRQLAKMELEGELNHSKEEGKMEGIKKGKIEGIKEGKIKVEKEKSIEIAIKLLKKGIDLNLVSEVTKLPVSKLQNLNNK